MAVSWKCPECGVEYKSVSPQDAAQALRSFPRRYREVIGPFIDDEDVLRRRPDPKTWSALEYTAHVADVLESMTPMLVEMAQRDDPRIPDPWDPDERARERRYNDMEPREVLDWLERAATKAADTVAGLNPEDWARTGEFDYGQREIIDQARNMVHEGVHHLRDVERVLRAVVGNPLPTDEDD
ncbi:MAG: methyltransferase type 12 [Acidimicrobiales bacterium]|nr:methyltransferase type 12 [Acidimicrobiales bacterium]